jgi:parvulin-like peptidyl-prolyl isomerase
MLCCAVWAQTPAPAPETPAEDPVVFAVGDEKMTRSEFEALIAALPEKARQELAAPQARRRFAENLSEIKALAQEARRRKISERADVKKQLQLTEDNLLANSLFQDLLSESAPSEEEVKAYYEEHKEEYETAKARHILIRFQGSRVPLREGQPDRSDEEALAQTQELRKRLLAGEDFAELAKAESDDTGSGADGGSLGEFGRGRMVPVFDEAVFTLPVGEVSEPVKSQFGYHLILVDQRGAKSLDEMREEIEQRQKPAKARATAEAIREKAKVVLNEDYFGKEPDEAPEPPAGQP